MTDEAPDTERPGPLVTCLCVTHERARWIPWMFSQAEKQTLNPLSLAIFSSSPLDASEVSREYLPDYSANSPVHQIEFAAIAPKRNIALESVSTPYFAWFDDDDWSHPERLERCVRLLEACPELVAAGPINAYKIDARTLKAYAYRSSEELIFNGAVYRTSHWKSIRFNEKLAVGEDTDWQKRGLRGQAYGVANMILSSWLCHGSNIANRSDRIIFHERFPAQLAQFKEELESNPEHRK